QGIQNSRDVCPHVQIASQGTADDSHQVGRSFTDDKAIEGLSKLPQPEPKKKPKPKQPPVVKSIPVAKIKTQQPFWKRMDIGTP
ncbi:MAG: hypothetical protein ABGX07_05865, partial [Pirellulaceae bacterium]